MMTFQLSPTKMIETTKHWPQHQDCRSSCGTLSCGMPSFYSAFYSAYRALSPFGIHVTCAPLGNTNPTKNNTNRHMVLPNFTSDSQGGIAEDSNKRICRATMGQLQLKMATNAGNASARRTGSQLVLRCNCFQVLGDKLAVVHHIYPRHHQDETLRKSGHDEHIHFSLLPLCFRLYQCLRTLHGQGHPQKGLHKSQTFNAPCEWELGHRTSNVLFLARASCSISISIRRMRRR